VAAPSDAPAPVAVAACVAVVAGCVVRVADAEDIFHFVAEVSSKKLAEEKLLKAESLVSNGRSLDLSST
jgi:hypothetical protein